MEKSWFKAEKKAQQLRSHATLEDYLSAKAQPGNSQHVVTSSLQDLLSSLVSLVACTHTLLPSYRQTLIQLKIKRNEIIVSQKKSNSCSKGLNRKKRRHDYIFLQSIALIQTNQNLIGKHERRNSIRKMTIFSIVKD